MKIVYIDITNIPKLRQYTGISRVVTEIAIRMIEDGVDVRLLSYDDAKHAYCVISNEYFLLCAKGVVTDKSRCYTDEFLKVEDMEPESVFFDVNSSWHTMPNRSWLLPKLKNKKIRIVPLLHDIIPVRHPQYMVGITLMRFMEFLMAHLKYADDIVVTTDFVTEDLKKLFKELNLPEKPIHKVGLGADFSIADAQTNTAAQVIDPEVVAALSGRKFLLTVGTVEPRKNHKVLIEAYEKKLADMGIDVVIVGRIGWEMEPLLNRIKANRNYGNGLYLFSGINDATLNYLYKKAFMVVFSSYIEGYGLPTIESLINGVPVICSDIQVMREVGGDFCDYFHPDDPDQLAAVVEKYHADNNKYLALRERLRTEYHPPVWDVTVNKLKNLFFSGSGEKHFEHKPIKQIVFLSARPAPILATLPHIEAYIPFITELVVCCPDFMADYMHENYKGRLKLTTITDGELLAGNELPPDHSTRNFFLRCLAMQLEQLDDEFIMCDDDYRPLKPLTEEVFYKNGKYRGYYFSDIDQWHYHIPKLYSYDYCHFRTLRFLKNHGYPTFQYSSHQPQVINKKWYQELIARYPEIIRKGYDEWSTYFNYCSAEHPDQYEAVPYVTLSWPNIGGENKGVEQSDYLFENFYAENYDHNKPFGRFAKVFTNAESIAEQNREKALIATRYRLEHRLSAKLQGKLSAEYDSQYREYPHVAVHFSGIKGAAPELGCPCCMSLSTTHVNKVRIGISRAENTSMNICSSTMEICVVDENNKCYTRRTVALSPRLNYTYVTFPLPGNLAQVCQGQLYLRVTASTAAPTVTVRKQIPVTLV